MKKGSSTYWPWQKKIKVDGEKRRSMRVEWAEEWYVRWRFARRTNNSDTLGQHDLIATVGMQIPTAHETCLRRMGVDPTKDHEIFRVAIIKQLLLIDGLARIRRARLFRDDQAGHEQRIRDQRPAENAARFQVQAGIRESDVEEHRPQIRREKECSQRSPVLEVRRWFECEVGRTRPTLWW